MLRSCATCAEQTDAKLRCARCRTDYCSRACQAAHWVSGGHNKACKGIARARRDTNLEVQSRALACVAHMIGGAPADARCLFCLDWGDTTDPLVRGCACRDSAGWTHMGCLVKSAEVAREPPPEELLFTPWISRLTCKQRFTGQVQLRFAIELWVKHVRAVEADQGRLLSAHVCACVRCCRGARRDRAVAMGRPGYARSHVGAQAPPGADLRLGF